MSSTEHPSDGSRVTVAFPRRSSSGTHVVYWMQASVRVRDNGALSWASKYACDHGLPLAVIFCLDFAYPEANARSFSFLVDGIQDVDRQLRQRGWELIVAHGDAAEIVPAAAVGAAVVVFDVAYLPWARTVRRRVAERVSCPVVSFEDNATEPVRAVSVREEWSAATLRPKLMSRVVFETDFELVPLVDAASGADLVRERLRRPSFRIADGLPTRNEVSRWPIDPSVQPTVKPGGESAAWASWESFRDHALHDYRDHRDDPNRRTTSDLSAYLHFGHLSPLSIVKDLRIRGLGSDAKTFRQAGEDSVSKFLDELIVRRELSFNFVVMNPAFNQWSGLPEWARRTLEAHAADRRPFLYGFDEWEQASTHDPIWNAAQRQLVHSGTIANTVRMYWGKKILEWSKTPQEAFQTAITLNNRYALDGRDPNSYAGVAWCFGKHDRPWGERSVYGLVRCMMESGLRRKFDTAEYVRRWGPAPP